jgi:hypothetical protein
VTTIAVGIAVYDELFSCMCAAEFVCALDVFTRHTSSRITFLTLTIVGRSRRCVSSHQDVFQTFGFPEGSTHTGEKIIIYCNANCKTENIIYLLECAICGLQYIGETKQQLSKRLNGHRSDANCKPDLPLSRHLRSTGHHDSFGKLKVTIIDHNPKWDDKSRQERESFWIRKLKTLSPNGINEKK